ncbi:MAG: hypothetical protein FWG20_05360, partial [Candidatus Cloacimonetes bacterium]|nr:hypothetical protein [Candidatus Cloacimonadota bacterium]
EGLLLSVNDDLQVILQLPDIEPEKKRTVFAYNLLMHENIEISSIAEKISLGEKYFIAKIDERKYYVLCENIQQLDSYFVYMIPEDKQTSKPKNILH